MRPAHYTVLRYVPDPGRNEALNVGILVWDASGYRLRLDDKAIERVVRDSPWLERDTLLQLDRLLRARLESVAPFSNDSLRQTLDRLADFPLLTTEPRFTTIEEDRPEALDETLDRLIARVVRPRQLPRGGAESLADAVERRLRPLIRLNRECQTHLFESTRSGLPRPVEFFADSGANVALDTVRLALRRASEIRKRADAKAFKIEDIRWANPGVDFLVYCNFLALPELQSANQAAQQVIESVGATVVTDLEAVVRAFESQSP